ncbi:hypothetical protein B484DRAFT_438145, partial [Ochromonadaceae sp. CCMP2298]
MDKDLEGCAHGAVGGLRVSSLGAARTGLPGSGPTHADKGIESMQTSAACRTEDPLALGFAALLGKIPGIARRLSQALLLLLLLTANPVASGESLEAPAAHLNATAAVDVERRRGAGEDVRPAPAGVTHMQLQSTRITYSYTGSGQSFVVPNAVYSMTVTAAGAAGGSFWNGYGAVVTTVVPVTPGRSCYIFVGGQGVYSSSSTGLKAGGYNGGGDG